MDPLLFKNRDKTDFLEDNHHALNNLINDINVRLSLTYERVSTISLTDIWVITYAEAGLKTNGVIDPRFRHSRGEVGLYPLIPRIKDWNGGDAPPWNSYSTLEDNVFHYFLYLGHLKNKVVKTVGGKKLYADLFSEPLHDSAVVLRHSKMLAGVVHGYFYEGNYDDHKIPLEHLINAYMAGERLSVMMHPTKYVHARTSILVNRENNISAALRDMRQFILTQPEDMLIAQHMRGRRG